MGWPNSGDPNASNNYGYTFAPDYIPEAGDPKKDLYSKGVMPTPGPPTDWSGMTIQMMVPMLNALHEGQYTGAATIWNNIVSQLTDMNTTMGNAGNTMMPGWDPTKSDAATAFYQQLGASLYSYQSWILFATQNKTALEGVATAITQAKKDMGPIYKNFLSEYNTNVSKANYYDTAAGQSEIMKLGVAEAAGGGMPDVSTDDFKKPYLQAAQAAISKYSDQARAVMQTLAGAYSQNWGALNEGITFQGPKTSVNPLDGLINKVNQNINAQNAAAKAAMQAAATQAAALQAAAQQKAAAAQAAANKKMAAAKAAAAAAQKKAQEQMAAQQKAAQTAAQAAQQKAQAQQAAAQKQLTAQQAAAAAQQQALAQQAAGRAALATAQQKAQAEQTAAEQQLAQQQKQLGNPQQIAVDGPGAAGLVPMRPGALGLTGAGTPGLNGNGRPGSAGLGDPEAINANGAGSAGLSGGRPNLGGLGRSGLTSGQQAGFSGRPPSNPGLRGRGGMGMGEEGHPPMGRKQGGDGTGGKGDGKEAARTLRPESEDYLMAGAPNSTAPPSGRLDGRFAFGAGTDGGPVVPPQAGLPGRLGGMPEMPGSPRGNRQLSREELAGRRQQRPGESLVEESEDLMAPPLLGRPNLSGRVGLPEFEWDQEIAGAEMGAESEMLGTRGPAAQPATPAEMPERLAGRGKGKERKDEEREQEQQQPSLVEASEELWTVATPEHIETPTEKKVEQERGQVLGGGTAA